MVLCGAACGCVYHHHPEQGCYQRTRHQDWGSSRMKMMSKNSNIINQRIILPPPSLVSSVCLLISTNFRVLLEGFCWMRIYEFHQIPSQGLPSDVPRLQWVNYANLKRFLHWRGETRDKRRWKEADKVDCVRHETRVLIWSDTLATLHQTRDWCGTFHIQISTSSQHSSKHYSWRGMSCMCWLFVCVAYPRDPNGAIFNSHLNKERLFKCWEFLFQRPVPNRVCFALLKEGREEMLSVGPRHPSPVCWQYTAPLFYLAWDHANASKQLSNKSMKKKHINPRAFKNSQQNLKSYASLVTRGQF